MRRFLLFFLMVCCAARFPASGAEGLFKMTFSTKWTAQAQFAGYYVALEKGFFRDEGLDVEIVHLSQTASGDFIGDLQDGKVDVVLEQLITAVKYRAAGVPLVNILQTSQNSSMMFVSHSPIQEVLESGGCRIGIWKTCGDFPLLVLGDRYRDYDTVPIMTSLSVFYSGAVDVVNATSYNEYYRILLAEGRVPEENVLRFSDIGYNYPEDGLYVTEEYYRLHPKEIDAFRRAVIRGWEYAAGHPEETLGTVLGYVKRCKVKINPYHQKMMLDEVLRLQLNPLTGKADFSPVPEALFNEITDKMTSLKLIKCPITYQDLIR